MMKNDFNLREMVWNIEYKSSIPTSWKLENTDCDNEFMLATKRNGIKKIQPLDSGTHSALWIPPSENLKELSNMEQVVLMSFLSQATNKKLYLAFQWEDLNNLTDIEVLTLQKVILSLQAKGFIHFGFIHQASTDQDWNYVLPNYWKAYGNIATKGLSEEAEEPRVRISKPIFDINSLGLLKYKDTITESDLFDWEFPQGDPLALKDSDCLSMLPAPKSNRLVRLTGSQILVLNFLIQQVTPNNQKLIISNAIMSEFLQLDEKTISAALTALERRGFIYRYLGKKATLDGGIYTFRYFILNYWKLYGI